MASNIVLARDFDVSKFAYGNIRSQDTGGKMINVSYDRNPLILQTPEMSLPFGLSHWSGGDGRNAGPEKYSLDLSFRGIEASEKLQQFLSVLKQLDRRLVNDALENSPIWFKKKYTSAEVVEALFTPLVRVAKDRQTGEPTDRYPPTFKVSLPFRENAFQCEVFDTKRNRISLLEQETKGAKVTAIIQCVGVWIAGGKFGCTWKALQLRVCPPAAIKGYAFREVEDDSMIESDVDDDDDDERQMATAAVGSKRTNAHLVESDDNDGEN